MSKDYKVYLDDILEAVGKIAIYTENLKFEEFVSDTKTIDAVIRNLEIIGEATRRIPEGIRTRHGEIEWHKIIGLHNILAHEYSGIDLEIIWEVIKEKLPLFGQQIMQVLKDAP
jgi:uncharacterized protein with HEPN domain